MLFLLLEVNYVSVCRDNVLLHTVYCPHFPNSIVLNRHGNKRHVPGRRGTQNPVDPGLALHPDDVHRLIPVANPRAIFKETHESQVVDTLRILRG